jgi:antitoxin component YwqK of YwqJK toxin-antitoxin module
MRYIFLFSFFVFLGCKKDIPQKIYYPDGKINYILKQKSDTTKITFFDENEKESMSLNFYKDHFVGNIFSNKYQDLPFKDSIIIDSLNGPYFYGTQYIIFKKGAERIGAYRYKRNLDFKKSLQSVQPFGIHSIFDINGNIIGKEEYMIVNDTVYNKKLNDNE